MVEGMHKIVQVSKMVETREFIRNLLYSIIYHDKQIV